MELVTVDFSELHFPRQEWQWLRAPVRYPTSPKEEPDAFLFAARVEGKLWAWHPRGTDLSTGFGGMQTRVLVLATDSSELAAHGLFLKTAFQNQPAQDIEWVCALDVLESRLNYILAERGTLPPGWALALSACGLEPHLGVLAQRKRFAFYTSAERQLLFEKRWDLATLELLETVRPELRALFIEALRKYGLSAAQAREASNLYVMFLRKLGEKPATTLLANGFKGGEEFRSALLHMAQPAVAMLTQKRIEMLRSLHVPPRSSVYGDPSFEKDMLKITCTPRNIGDFEAFKSWILEPGVTEKVKALLEIYQ